MPQHVNVASDRANEALRWLERRGTKRNREGMARYGIVAPKVFGVSMATMQPLAKRLGRDHDLALALWNTGWFEARILTSFVDEPSRVTARQMDQWARDFAAARWVGKDVLRDSLRPAVKQRLAARERKVKNAR